MHDETSGFGFEIALDSLKAGRKVYRTGWNGTDMWIGLQEPDEHSANTLPYLYIQYKVGHPKYPDGARCPWLASQTDILANDWFVKEL